MYTVTHESLLKSDLLRWLLPPQLNLYKQFIFTWLHILEPAFPHHFFPVSKDKTHRKPIVNKRILGRRVGETKSEGLSFPTASLRKSLISCSEIYERGWERIGLNSLFEAVCLLHRDRLEGTSKPFYGSIWAHGHGLCVCISVFVWVSCARLCAKLVRLCVFFS